MAPNKNPDLLTRPGSQSGSGSKSRLYDTQKNTEIQGLDRPGDGSKRADGFCSGVGQYHSTENKKDPQSYLAITLPEIEAMASNPQNIAKPEARWAILSTLSSRKHAEQREHGQFGGAWVDIDEYLNGFNFVVDEAKRIFPGMKIILYTTKSATPENRKCRIIFPFENPCPGKNFILVQKIFNDRLEKAGIQPDRKTEHAGQICYLPNRGEHYQSHIEPGAGLNWEASFSQELKVEKERIKSAEIALAERREQSRKKGIARLASGTLSPIDAFNEAYSVEDCLLQYGYVPRGKRYTSPNSRSGSAGVSVQEGGRWTSSHGSDLETTGVSGDAFDLYRFSEHNNDMAAALKAAGEMFMVDGVSLNKANQKVYAKSNALGGYEETAETKAYRLTELGNAERFRDQHGEKVRYVSNWKKWIHFDGTRWKVGAEDKIRLMAHGTVKNLYLEAAQTSDNDMAQKIAKWAAQSCKSNSISAMLKEASALLALDASILDADPWLFNCQNCTIDLKTGKVRPHTQTDWITKITPVAFDPQATAPRFERVLNVSFAGNQELIRFVQRFAGYCLSGSTREQCIFIWWGSGANGKSTILNAVAETLGDYAQTTRPETLMVQRGDGIPSDLAKLKGARLVTAAEAEDGHRLAESQVKQLTGGEKIQARALYQDWFEFTPEFKLVLCTNHKPVIRGDDLAIWRRIRLVPFTVTIPEPDRDQNLPEKLRAEMPGILTWIVTGAAEWLASGLGKPAAVQEATEEYRSEQSLINNFLDSCCVLKTDAQVEGGQLFQAFDRWRTNEGQRKVTMTKFGTMISQLGFEKSRAPGTGRAIYKGVGLTTHHTTHNPPQEISL